MTNVKGSDPFTKVFGRYVDAGVGRYQKLRISLLGFFCGIEAFLLQSLQYLEQSHMHNISMVQVL